MKRLTQTATTVKWRKIGKPYWDDSQMTVGEIPNCGMSPYCWIVCDPDPTSGWTIIGPFDKNFIDNLHVGRVKLLPQYKNRNVEKKFLKPGLPEDRVHKIAEDFMKRFQRA